MARKIATALWYLLMGKFTPMQEPTKTLEHKLLVLARYIGAPALKKQGYKTYGVFIAEKIATITQTA